MSLGLEYIIISISFKFRQFQYLYKDTCKKKCKLFFEQQDILAEHFSTWDLYQFQLCGQT